MTIQVLIATMNQTDYLLLDRMKINSDAVVVNQCNEESQTVLNYRGHTVLWINTTERGLSKSRNMAIRNATADICMLADDDMEYHADYTDIVCSAFNNISADIISFQVCGIEQQFKKYSNKSCAISHMKSMKIASVEIAFRRDIFIANDIMFDEIIGAGTEFMMGEENAMLLQCLHKKMKIYYEPKQIANLHIGNSSWFTERNKQFFTGKGAAFAAMKTPFTSLLILQWALRKRALYKQSISTYEAIKAMQKGKKMYLQKVKEIMK